MPTVRLKEPADAGAKRAVYAPEVLLARVKSAPTLDVMPLMLKAPPSRLPVWIAPRSVGLAASLP
jgi:hypothetical protein